MAYSAVHFATKHRLDAEFAKLDRDKITHWLMRLSAQQHVDIDDCRGGRITTGGAFKFEGTIRDVYWSFITPCLEDIVDETLNAADELGGKHSPSLALRGLDEAALLLKAFVRRIFKRMVDVDRLLRGAGHPGRVDPYDASPKIGQFEQLVEVRCQALKDLYSNGSTAVATRIEDSSIDEYDALVADVVRSSYQFLAGNLVRWFFCLDNTPAFARLLHDKFQPEAGFANWWESYNLVMMGAALKDFEWPRGTATRLGVQLLLLRRFAEGAIDFGGFGLTVLRASANRNAGVREIVNQIFTPASTERKRRPHATFLKVCSVA